MINVFKKNKKGFGLLEVLVSAVIVILILSSLVMIGRRALANSAYYEQRAQAIFLAQESLEEVRHIRDTNWIDKNNQSEWCDLVYTSTVENPDCVGNISSLNSSTNLKSSFFTKRTLLAPGEENNILLSGVNFSRVIRVQPGNELGSILRNPDIPDDKFRNINAIKIVVTVSWKFDGDHSVSVSEILTNWRPNF